MTKTEVYSWRLSPDLKNALEEAARRERESVAGLLERITLEWLDRSRFGDGQDTVIQNELHGAVARTFGTIAGGDPQRSASVQQAVRARLDKRRAR